MLLFRNNTNEEQTWKLLSIFLLIVLSGEWRRTNCGSHPPRDDQPHHPAPPLQPTCRCFTDFCLRSVLPAQEHNIWAIVYCQSCCKCVPTQETSSLDYEGLFLSLMGDHHAHELLIKEMMMTSSSLPPYDRHLLTSLNQCLTMSYSSVLAVRQESERLQENLNRAKYGRNYSETQFLAAAAQEDIP